LVRKLLTKERLIEKYGNGKKEEEEEEEEENNSNWE